MKKLIVLLSMFFVGTLYAQSMVTSGDINKSMVTDYKQFFTKENCNQVLIDTFSICYDWKRKSPTAVYVEVTGENVVKDIEKRPPFFTDKRVRNSIEQPVKTTPSQDMIEVTLGHQTPVTTGTRNIRRRPTQWRTSYHKHHVLTDTSLSRWRNTKERWPSNTEDLRTSHLHTGMLNQRLSVSRNSMYHQPSPRFSLVKDIVNVSSSGIQKSTMKVTDKTQTNDTILCTRKFIPKCPDLCRLRFWFDRSVLPLVERS